MGPAGGLGVGGSTVASGVRPSTDSPQRSNICSSKVSFTEISDCFFLNGLHCLCEEVV